MGFVEDGEVERYPLQEPDVRKLLVVRPGFRGGTVVLDLADPTAIGHDRSVIFSDC
ncbi:MAG: hypothetical protein ACOYL3_14990 [Desulfuromonadaceae bacterium]